MEGHIGSQRDVEDVWRLCKECVKSEQGAWWVHRLFRLGYKGVQRCLD